MKIPPAERPRPADETGEKIGVDDDHLAFVVPDDGVGNLGGGSAVGDLGVLVDTAFELVLPAPP